MIIFLDESGNFTAPDTNYFIIATFTTSDVKKLTKNFVKWKNIKFPKKVQHQPEIKFNDPIINHDLRLKTLSCLSSLDIKIYYSYLHRNNIPQEYYRKGQLFKTGLLYTEIVATTLEQYLPIYDNTIQIIRDNRTLKGITKEMFNETIKTSLLPKLTAKTYINIDPVDSTTNIGVQVADWINGALARYHEGKSYGVEYFNILRDSIVRKKELFIPEWKH